MFIFFIILIFWFIVKWYILLDILDSDCWFLFMVYVGGLFIGVYLLSLLIFFVLGLFYYFKKYKNYNFLGMVVVVGIGVVVLGVI